MNFKGWTKGDVYQQNRCLEQEHENIPETLYFIQLVERVGSIVSNLALNTSDAVLAARVDATASLREDGHLEYFHDERGDTIPDFSAVGYKSGEVPIPFVSTKFVVNTSNGTQDDTAMIQNALDTVGAMPMGPDGFRGAVQLSAGTFNIDGQLRLRHESGVVLRGEGALTNLLARGTDTRHLIEMGQSSPVYNGDGNAQSVTSQYVAVGATELEIPDACYFEVGDHIVITRSQSQQWLDDIGMGIYWSTSTVVPKFYRDVVWIANDCRKLRFNAPIVASLDAQYGGGTVEKLVLSSSIVENVGVENMHSASEFISNSDINHASSLAIIQTMSLGMENGTAEDNRGTANLPLVLIEALSLSSMSIRARVRDQHGLFSHDS